MNKFSQILTVSMICLTVLGLGSCGSTEVQVESDSSAELTETHSESSETGTTENQSTTSDPHKTISTPILKEAVTPTDTIPVTVYRVDRECSELVPEKVTVSEDSAVEDAVAKTLEIQPGFELPLSYRVEVDSYYQVAIIDFRVATTSPRNLSSLSTC
ncbi:MAG: hypothetical protein SWJ54_18190, partial [Cyanobacteriota bacterium]|nr:hypothetical protein [Cyanobacteriota bacterium]